MASASSTLLLAVALALTPCLASAAPPLSGSYRTESLGRVELATQGDRLTGVTAGENACKFEGRKPVLEGTFEGNVLVGSLTLCQTGAGCTAQQSYSIFAIYNPASGALTAHVPLAPGCQSPALKGNRLVLMPASAPSEKAQASGEAAAASDPVTRMLMEGEAAYRQGDYDSALKSFEAVLSLKEGDPIATHFKGAMLLLKNEPREAIKWLEKARNLNGNHRDTVYLLACAYGRVGKKKVAMDYLRMAVRLGYPLTPALYDNEADLRNLLGSKDALQELVQQVRSRKGSARERQESSDP